MLNVLETCLSISAVLCTYVLKRVQLCGATVLQLNQERVQVDVGPGVGIAGLYGRRQNSVLFVRPPVEW